MDIKDKLVILYCNEGRQDSLTYSLKVHFTVVCLVAKTLNRSEARVDFVVISYVDHSVNMLTSFSSLSFQDHL